MLKDHDKNGMNRIEFIDFNRLSMRVVDWLVIFYSDRKDPCS